MNGLLVFAFFSSFWLASVHAANDSGRPDDDVGANVGPHPDPNEEDYDNMIYIGRMEIMEDGSVRRMGFDYDNSVKYIFGTGFDETHRDIEEEDLRHAHYGPDSRHDIPQAGTPHMTREEALKELRHGKVNPDGPKPFGHVDVHDLDGGVVPPQGGVGGALFFGRRLGHQQGVRQIRPVDLLRDRSGAFRVEFCSQQFRAAAVHGPPARQGPRGRALVGRGRRLLATSRGARLHLPPARKPPRGARLAPRRRRVLPVGGQTASGRTGMGSRRPCRLLGTQQPHPLCVGRRHLVDDRPPARQSLGTGRIPLRQSGRRRMERNQSQPTLSAEPNGILRHDWQRMVRDRLAGHRHLKSFSSESQPKPFCFASGWLLFVGNG